MNRYSNMIAASTALFLAFAAPPSIAAGVSIGGTSLSVGTKDGVSAKAGTSLLDGADVDANIGSGGAAARASVGGGDADADATIGTGGSGRGATATANSTLLTDTRARAALLDNRQLAKLCATVGGGDCGGSRASVLASVNAALGDLSAGDLAAVCVGIGGTCSGAGVGGDQGGKGGNGGLGSRAGAKAVPPALAGMSAGEIAAYQKRCASVYADPKAFDTDLVELCRLLRRM